jgi:hypothetical protein
MSDMDRAPESEAPAADWPLREMLAEVIKRFPAQHSVPRAWAAEVLEAVGSRIAYGNSASGYTPREVGWALVRVYSVFNATALGELIQGYREATAYYADGTLPDDLKPPAPAL